MQSIPYVISFLVLTVMMLTHSGLSLAYASLGLELWFQKMIPTLLPFMILSGLMIRLHLTRYFVAFVHPVLKPVFRVCKAGSYAIIIGFLCGFPMGAKTIADLLKRGELDKKQASFLLAFCNNIGPIYFCSFALPILHRKLQLPYLFGMYGIPLLYGILLRRTPFYRDFQYYEDKISTKEHILKTKLLDELDDCIFSSLKSIAGLGGYMVFFNLLNLVPHVLFGKKPFLLSPFLEITGGLHIAEKLPPLYALLLLSFGGCSCIAQTYSCIKGSGLKLAPYIIHKVILTVLTALFYLCWYLVSPGTFLL